MKLLSEGQRAFDGGDYDRAIELMNVASRMNLDRNRTSAAISCRGAAYAMKEDYNRAMRDFDLAIKFNPTNSDAFRNRGTLWAKEGQPDAAEKDLNRAIEINPRSSRAYLTRAEVKRFRHKISEALDDLNRAITLNPQDADAYAIRAVLYLKSRRDDQAMSDCEKAIHLDPNCSRAYSCRVNLYTRARRYDAADGDLHALTILRSKEPARPWNDIAWFRATCLDDKMRDGKMAVEAATKACTLSNWRKARCLDTLAAAFAETGEFDQAIKFEEQALKAIEPELDESKFRERLALYQQGRPYRDRLEP